MQGRMVAPFGVAVNARGSRVFVAHGLVVGGKDPRSDGFVVSEFDTVSQPHCPGSKRFVRVVPVVVLAAGHDVGLSVLIQHMAQDTGEWKGCLGPGRMSKSKGGAKLTPKSTLAGLACGRGGAVAVLSDTEMLLLYRLPPGGAGATSVSAMDGVGAIRGVVPLFLSWWCMRWLVERLPARVSRGEKDANPAVA